jgi:hypothetical protein
MLITIGIVVSLIINVICLIYIFSHNKRVRELEGDIEKILRDMKDLRDLRWEINDYFNISKKVNESLDSVNESNKTISEILNKL